MMLLLPLSCVPLSLTLPTSETQLPSVNAGFRLKSVPQVLSFSPDVQCSDLFNVLKKFFLNLFVWPCHTACGISVPRPGIDSRRG